MKVKMMGLAVCLLAIVAGCRKIEKPGVKNGEENSVQKIGIARSNNPFEKIGQNHNEVVAAYMKHLEAAGDTSRQARIKFIVQYNKEFKGKDVSKTVGTIAYKFDRETCMAPFQKLGYRGETIKCVGDIWDTIEALKEHRDYGRMQKELLEIEQEIAHLKIPEEERANLFKVSAVAKYSCAFYKEKVLDQPIKSNGRSLFTRILGAVIVAHADFTGANLGVLFGDVEGVSEELSTYALFWAYCNGWG